MGSPVAMELAPGVPSDYYRAIADAEAAHWWHRGMLEISASLLGPRLTSGKRGLDAGCGTGGFLRFLADRGHFTSLAGADLASVAIELARERVPEADLHVAPLHALPFESETFDLVATNDVLQHVPEPDVAPSLRELRRVLAPGGTLLVRTNGSRHLRVERADWRAYDAPTLRHELGAAGFRLRHVTHANCLLSVLSAARGQSPHAPSLTRHGVPSGTSSQLVAAAGTRLLRTEAWWLGQGRSLPYGHTLFALAEKS